ncbi:hypothetical protein Taro_022339 [Colocasia esculenta]|uniref:Uncharacterized protein n=1 Tax=Colocasia esculenta TaxID=4460 RepID=A0A843V154_COLES|nr:hypothetical protein [Colocasia esculenta]
MLNVTGRYVTFRSEGGTLVVATWWRQVGRRLLVQKVTPLWSCSGCLCFWPWFVPWLADGPPGGSQEVCRACRCLLGLSWLQTSYAGFCGGCPANSLSLGARHLRACPQDMLLPLPGTPGPHAPVRGSSPGGGFYSSHGLCCVGRSGVEPQLGRAAVVRVCVFFAVAHSPHSTGEVVGSS